MRLFVLYLGCLAAVCSADLHKMVRYFDTLDLDNMQVVTRKKRTSDGTILSSKHISFKTLGRKFNMVLFPGSSVIGPDFRARTVDMDGRVETFVVNPNNFYTGFLEDDKTVEIDADLEDGILTASIYFSNETYAIEPAWRHRLTSTNATMIAYRRSDVIWDEIFPIDPKTGKRTRMKDGIRLPVVNSTIPEEANKSENGSSRHKRSVVKNICPLLTVADYYFFREIGNNKRRTSAAYIISAMQRVNRYFNRTVWDPDAEYKNMRFHISEMIIHTHFTTSPSYHYNAERNWDYAERLDAFSHRKGIDKVCLAHLFTSYAFADNVLGLAYTADAKILQGGICSIWSPGYDGRGAYLRTGMSSTKNSKGEQVLTLQATLVTTHEFGHSWGANHDAMTKECAPDSKHDGKYIMWYISVVGYEKNNQVPMYKRYVTAVLKSKSSMCFTEKIKYIPDLEHLYYVMAEESRETSMCGNGIIEMNEECDPGTVFGDNCCDRHCQLHRNATCSDFNYDCCRGCRTARSSVICNDRNALTCKDRSFCNGQSLECPKPGYLPDNTTCIDRGMCFKGQCLNYCEILGISKGKTMKPCLCKQNVTAMCRRCCAEMIGEVKGPCLPTPESMRPGQTCLIGYCEQTGRCVSSQRKSTTRLWDLLTDMSISNLMEFFHTNIVGAIIVLSLIVWVPICLIVNIWISQMMSLSMRPLSVVEVAENYVPQTATTNLSFYPVKKNESFSSAAVHPSIVKITEPGTEPKAVRSVRCSVETPIAKLTEPDTEREAAVHPSVETPIAKLTEPDTEREAAVNPSVETPIAKLTEPDTEREAAVHPSVETPIAKLTKPGTEPKAVHSSQEMPIVTLTEPNREQME